MRSFKMPSKVFSEMLVSENVKLDKYRESITTILLGLDILEDINDSQKNKDLVQIVRHSFERMFEIFLEDENKSP
jgi:hypothetical protein